MSKEIDLLCLASSQALSPAHFHAKVGFPGNVESKPPAYAWHIANNVQACMYYTNIVCW